MEFPVPLSTVSLYTSEGALKIARQAVKAESYPWQYSLPDALFVLSDELQELNDELPIPELIFASRQQGLKGNQSHYLCWKVVVETYSPSYEISDVYINAKTGKVEQVLSELRPFKTQEADLDYGYGRRRIDVRTYVPYIGRVYDYLRALDNGRNITTKSFEPNKRFDQMSDERLYNGDNDFIWPIGRAQETTAHWAVANVYDYFSQVHGLSGWNDNGEHVQVQTQNPFGGGEGPFYGGNRLFFGRNTEFYNGHGATLDIAGHEWTHGVMDELNILDYAREPGALNESFADIFGVLAERFANITPFDWELGEDAFRPVALRNMANPRLGLFAQPDTYLGINWQDITTAPPSRDNDQQGVHINSGVQNRWFSLLAAGGTLNGIAVQSIGIDNAARIAFMNMTRFMQFTSQYADARQGSISAARILFGDCSREVEQTTNAWAAVGVGPRFDNRCTAVSGPSYMCTDRTTYPLIYTARVPAGTTVTWNVPSNFTTTVSGTGNTQLRVTNIFNPTPNSTVTITANSSRGGRASTTLRLERCNGGGGDCDPRIEFCANSTTYDTSPSTIDGVDIDPVVVGSELLEFSIYPNPTSDLIRLTSSQPFVSQMTIFDLNGRLVKSNPVFVSSDYISVSDLPDGVYTLQLRSQEGSQVKVARFIKQ